MNLRELGVLLLEMNFQFKYFVFPLTIECE